MPTEQNVQFQSAVPQFTVPDVVRTAEYYRDVLGFVIAGYWDGEEASLRTEPPPFFGIVRRGAAMIMLKAVGVEPVPNYTRDVQKGWARWDAYVNVPDPDALAAEFSARHVEFSQPLKDDEDGLRGFELKDADGYVLFFGRPTNAV